MEQLLKQVLSTNNLAITLSAVAIWFFWGERKVLLEKIKELEIKFENFHNESTDRILNLSTEIAKMKGRKDGADTVANTIAKELNVKLDQIAKSIDRK
jgi:hypothetical protein